MQVSRQRGKRDGPQSRRMLGATDVVKPLVADVAGSVAALFGSRRDLDATNSNRSATSPSNFAVNVGNTRNAASAQGAKDQPAGTARTAQPRRTRPVPYHLNRSTRSPLQLRCQRVAHLAIDAGDCRAHAPPAFEGNGKHAGSPSHFSAFWEARLPAKLRAAVNTEWHVGQRRASCS